MFFSVSNEDKKTTKKGKVHKRSKTSIKLIAQSVVGRFNVIIIIKCSFGKKNL